ncbi:hypothetical protein [Nocardia xishanensis]|uniref:hypothetical protein n=1 Tax=Nocardia xishanensis TaxID=238964 RepID=UPI0008296F08|nr:hypothetical protein [Nocardia xishanensis]
MSIPVKRTLRARTSDQVKTRDAMQSKFDRLVDPDGLLSPEERAYRAAHARRAHNARRLRGRNGRKVGDQ